MAKAVKRVELAQYLLYEGGQALTPLQPLELSTTSEAPDGLVWIRRLRLVIGVHWVDSPEAWNDVGSILIADKLIRLTYTDNTISEWVILTVTEAADGLTYVITARGLIEDLNRRVELVTEEVEGRPGYAVTKRATVSNQLSYALGFGPAHFALGTITPTVEVELTLTGANPLAWCVAAVQAANKLLATTYELWEEWDSGAGKFKLHCGIRNSAAPVVDLLFAKNLESIEILEDGSPRATRVQTLDPQSWGMDDNAWEVVAKSTDAWVEYEGIGGLAHPMIEDYCLDGLYVVDQANGKHQITASTIISAVRMRLAMTSTANINVGDWNRIARDSSGLGLRYLRKPSTEAIRKPAHVKLPRETPAYTNWARNPLLTGTGSLPTSWSLLGSNNPTRITTAGLWRSAGQSWKMGTGSCGMEQPQAVYFYRTGWFTYLLWIYVESYGATGVYPVNDVSVVRFRDPQSGTYEEVCLDSGTLGAWYLITKTFQITSTGSKTCNVQGFRGLTSAGVFYLDSVAYAMAGGVSTVIEGSGGAQHMVDAVAYMREFAESAYSWQGAFSDLTRAFPGFYPDDELLEGGSVRIRIPRPLTDQVETLRLVRLVRDELDPSKSSGLLSTRRRTLTGAIA